MSKKFTIAIQSDDSSPFAAFQRLAHTLMSPKDRQLYALLLNPMTPPSEFIILFSGYLGKLAEDAPDIAQLEADLKQPNRAVGSGGKAAFQKAVKQVFEITMLTFTGFQGLAAVIAATRKNQSKDEVENIADRLGLVADMLKNFKHNDFQGADTPTYKLYKANKFMPMIEKYVEFIADLPDVFQFFRTMFPYLPVLQSNTEAADAIAEELGTVNKALNTEIYATLQEFPKLFFRGFANTKQMDNYIQEQTDPIGRYKEIGKQLTDVVRTLNKGIENNKPSPYGDLKPFLQYLRALPDYSIVVAKRSTAKGPESQAASIDPKTLGGKDMPKIGKNQFIPRIVPEVKNNLRSKDLDGANGVLYMAGKNMLTILKAQEAYLLGAEGKNFVGKAYALGTVCMFLAKTHLLYNLNPQERATSFDFNSPQFRNLSMIMELIKKGVSRQVFHELGYLDITSQGRGVNETQFANLVRTATNGITETGFGVGELDAVIDTFREFMKIPFSEYMISAKGLDTESIMGANSPLTESFAKIFSFSAEYFSQSVGMINQFVNDMASVFASIDFRGTPLRPNTYFACFVYGNQVLFDAKDQLYAKVEAYINTNVYPIAEGDEDDAYSINTGIRGARAMKQTVKTIRETIKEQKAFAKAIETPNFTEQRRKEIPESAQAYFKAMGGDAVPSLGTAKMNVLLHKVSPLFHNYLPDQQPQRYNESNFRTYGEDFETLLDSLKDSDLFEKLEKKKVRELSKKAETIYEAYNIVVASYMKSISILLGGISNYSVYKSNLLSLEKLATEREKVTADFEAYVLTSGLQTPDDVTRSALWGEFLALHPDRVSEYVSLSKNISSLCGIDETAYNGNDYYEYLHMSLGTDVFATWNFGSKPVKKDKKLVKHFKSSVTQKRREKTYFSVKALTNFAEIGDEFALYTKEGVDNFNGLKNMVSDIVLSLDEMKENPELLGDRVSGLMATSVDLAINGQNALGMVTPKTQKVKAVSDLDSTMKLVKKVFFELAVFIDKRELTSFPIFLSQFTSVLNTEMELDKLKSNLEKKFLDLVRDTFLDNSVQNFQQITHNLLIAGIDRKGLSNLDLQNYQEQVTPAVAGLAGDMANKYTNSSGLYSNSPSAVLVKPNDNFKHSSVAISLGEAKHSHQNYNASLALKGKNRFYVDASDTQADMSFAIASGSIGLTKALYVGMGEDVEGFDFHQVLEKTTEPSNKVIPPSDAIEKAAALRQAIKDQKLAEARAKSDAMMARLSESDRAALDAKKKAQEGQRRRTAAENVIKKIVNNKIKKKVGRGQLTFSADDVEEVRESLRGVSDKDKELLSSIKFDPETFTFTDKHTLQLGDEAFKAREKTRQADVKKALDKFQDEQERAMEAKRLHDEFIASLTPEQKIERQRILGEKFEAAKQEKAKKSAAAEKKARKRARDRINKLLAKESRTPEEIKLMLKDYEVLGEKTLPPEIEAARQAQSQADKASAAERKAELADDPASQKKELQAAKLRKYFGLEAKASIIAGKRTNQVSELVTQFIEKGGSPEETEIFKRVLTQYLTVGGPVGENPEFDRLDEFLRRTGIQLAAPNIQEQLRAIEGVDVSDAVANLVQRFQAGKKEFENIQAEAAAELQDVKGKGQAQKVYGIEGTREYQGGKMNLALLYRPKGEKGIFKIGERYDRPLTFGDKPKRTKALKGYTDAVFLGGTVTTIGGQEVSIFHQTPPKTHALDKGAIISYEDMTMGETFGSYGEQVDKAKSVFAFMAANQASSSFGGQAGAAQAKESFQDPRPSVQYDASSGRVIPDASTPNYRKATLRDVPVEQGTLLFDPLNPAKKVKRIFGTRKDLAIQK